MNYLFLLISSCILIGCGGSSESGDNSNGGSGLDHESDDNDTIYGVITYLDDRTNYPYYVDTVIDADLFLNANVYNYQPEGVHDGGESESVFIFIRDSSVVKEGTYEIGHPNFYWVYETIYDPGGFDHYQQSELNGAIEILDYGRRIKAVVQIDISEYMDSIPSSYPIIFTE
jgi:hypothetical protein